MVWKEGLRFRLTSWERYAPVMPVPSGQIVLGDAPFAKQRPECVGIQPDPDAPDLRPHWRFLLPRHSQSEPWR